MYTHTEVLELLLISPLYHKFSTILHWFSSLRIKHWGLFLESICPESALHDPIPQLPFILLFPQGTAHREAGKCKHCWKRADNGATSFSAIKSNALDIFDVLLFCEGYYKLYRDRKDHMLSAPFNEILILLNHQFTQLLFSLLGRDRSPQTLPGWKSVLSATRQSTVPSNTGKPSNLRNLCDVIIFHFYQHFQPWEFFLTIQRIKLEL